jgi:hypothetical protein
LQQSKNCHAKTSGEASIFFFPSLFFFQKYSYLPLNKACFAAPWSGGDAPFIATRALSA